jgi:hypothetical protein
MMSHVKSISTSPDGNVGVLLHHEEEKVNIFLFVTSPSFQEQGGITGRHDRVILSTLNITSV